MKKLMVALLLLTTVYSCKKDKRKAFSTWSVNGQKFSTNDVRLDFGKAIYILSTNNFDRDSNGFLIVINGGGVLPAHRLDCPTDMCFKIRYKANYYVGKLPGRVTSSYNNHRNSFNLNETWFYKMNYTAEDSVLVKGVFSEP
ncbi:MAG TPA: hypothetical protein VFL76_02130 [Edaphocola sp.]|nr:hypothetical protein [Edaphocola sp.]